MMESVVFLGLNLYAWVTILTMVSIFVVLSRTHVPAEVAFLSALTVLLCFGIVTESEGMAGFGSEPVVVDQASAGLPEELSRGYPHTHDTHISACSTAQFGERRGIVH